MSDLVGNPEGRFSHNEAQLSEDGETENKRAAHRSRLSRCKGTLEGKHVVFFYSCIPYLDNLSIVWVSVKNLPEPFGKRRFLVATVFRVTLV